ncbi:hypothetical protein ABLE68_13510 [Nocardioides sp. CN2-186]|uniref:hypothetical protein n=1 Tax=Nocardioides tweenelious TaxID=3156607 RepID=UPI0032B42979
MEIETAPHRPAPTPWGRLLLSIVVFGPVTFLVLLPIGLGLERYVMSGDSMAGSIGQGSIVFERVVPVSDLRPGDVITYEPPAAADVDGMVTHRIVAIGPEGIVTKGDAETAVDPWTLRPAGQTMSRVAFSVPWVGWAYLFLFHPQGWLLTVGSAMALALLMSRRLMAKQPTLRPPSDGTEADSAVLHEVKP